jgi:ABC-type transporter Mla subunit MlaD
VLAGVFGFMWNLESARLDACQARGQQWADAQAKNRQTIDGLIDKLKEVTARHAANKKAAATAADRVAAQAAEDAKELAATKKELEGVYARLPHARAWGRAGVDRDVADRLPTGTD